jgi:O-antigen/teichoic acid export membrane protein
MTKKNRAVTILKGTIANYVRQITQIFVFICLTPFIVEQVGATNFGLWSLVQATVGLLGLIDMGFSASVVKYVADARGRKDPKRLGDLTATLFWIYLALGTALMGVAFLLAPHLGSLLSVPSELEKTGQIVFLLIAFRAAQGLPLGMFIGVLVGFQRQVLSNAIRTLGTLTYGLLAWWALSYSPSIELLALVSACTGTFWNILAMVTAFKRTTDISISPKRFKKSLVKEVTSFSIYFFLIQISLLIATRLDTVIISLFLPLTAVALYSVAIGIVEKASILCRQLTNALTPVVAELKGAKEDKNIRAVLRKGSNLTFAFAAPLLFGLAWYADDLVVTWIGEDFQQSALPLRILLLAAIINVLHANAENVLTMTGNQAYLAKVMFAEQLCNVGLSLILIKPLGIAGVALATLIVVTVMQFVFVASRLNKEYGFSRREFYGSAILPVTAGLIPMFAYCWALGLKFKPTALWHVGLLEIGACIIFFLGYITFGMNKKDRSYYSSRILKALGKEPKGAR